MGTLSLTGPEKRRAAVPMSVMIPAASKKPLLQRAWNGLLTYQLSLAIGKEGQNARLAAKLTGWKIDIKSETQARESAEAAAGEENGDEA